MRFMTRLLVLVLAFALWTFFFLVGHSLLVPCDVQCKNAKAHMEPLSKINENYSRNGGVPKNNEQFGHSVERKIVLPRQFGPGNDGSKIKFDKKNLHFKREKDQKHGFNMLVSDEIGVHRRLKDVREERCRDKTYRKDLPPVSVIITCRDELPSLVLRTAYSVLEMSPSELIKEIIIVDDGSTDQELIAKLDFHVDNVDKFRLVRNNVSLGLMKARQAGIDASTADYFIAMDGHMEVGPYWLEPLIDRLIDNPKALLTSHVHSISVEDFSLRETQPQLLFFDHIRLFDMYTPYSQAFLNSRNDSVEPIQNAIIQGMMTVMKKDFFYQLGGFDTGMEVWGYEQFELSIKVWMCGGVVEKIPCSFVGHLYKPTPWTKESSIHNNLNRNRARLARVWMDPPQQQIVLAHVPAGIDPGNLTDRIAIRKNNKCKPYQYFIDKVKSISGAYILDKPKQFGLLFNKRFKQCLEIHTNSRIIKTYHCHGYDHQVFYLTEYSEIRSFMNSVIKAVRNNADCRIKLFDNPRVDESTEAQWDYLTDETIVNKGCGLCLTALPESKVGLEKCSNKDEQKWTWAYVKGLPK